MAVVLGKGSAVQHGNTDAGCSGVLGHVQEGSQAPAFQVIQIQPAQGGEGQLFSVRGGRYAPGFADNKISLQKLIHRDLLVQREGAVVDVRHHAAIAHAGQDVAPVNGLRFKVAQGRFCGGQHRGSPGVIEVQLVRQHQKRSVPGIGAALELAAKQGGVEGAGRKGLSRLSVRGRSRNHRSVGGGTS